MNVFEKYIDVRWADVDHNQHVRHSAYYDYGAHVRIRFFQENGYDSKKLAELKLGPILFHEECSFLREIHLGETIKVNLLKGELKPDASKWSLHHELFNAREEKIAHITIKGAWMDTLKRKLIVPPPEIAATMHNLPQGARFVYENYVQDKR
jgi:acyl-CoA thioester hydrolase